METKGWDTRLGTGGGYLNEMATKSNMSSNCSLEIDFTPNTQVPQIRPS
jgi:hypothetical protein